MKVRDYYERVAEERTPNYQQSSWWMDALVHRPNERFVRRHVGTFLEGVVSVADCGCGNGEHLDSAYPRLERILINDIAPNMLDETEARARDANPSIAVDRHLGSIETVPAGADPCEALLCLGVMNHFDGGQVDLALEAFARLARRKILLYYAHDGFLLSGSVGRSFRGIGIHYQALDRAEVERGLATHGFELVRSAYAFRLASLSPLVVQEFRRTGAATER